MISISTIQAELITYLKAKATITAVVSSAEIREDQWKGTDFKYPNVRVAMQPNMPMTDRNCTGNITEVWIYINSETSNSKEADDIAAIVATELHNKAFGQGGLKFTGMNVTQLIPASSSADGKTWTAQVRIRGTVN